MRRTVTFLTLLSFVALGAGFLRELAIAYHFGTSGEADAFALVMYYVDGISAVALYGLAGYAMVPVVARARVRGDPREPFHILDASMVWATLVLLPLLAVILAAPEWIAGVIAPDFPPAQRAVLSVLVRFGGPTCVIVILGGIASGVLQGLNAYYSPVLGRVVFAGTTAALLALAAHKWDIEAGAIGLLVGAMLQLLVQVAALWRLGWRPARPRLRHPALRGALALALPSVIALLLMNVLMGGGQRALASRLPEGAFSAVNYAFRTLNLVAMPTYALATVFLTQLATEFHTRGCGPGTDALVRQGLRTGLQVLLPLSALAFVASDPLVGALFQRGAYDEGSRHLTVACLRWLIVALIPGLILTILHRAAPALERPWLAVVISTVWLVATLAATAVLLSRLGAQALPAGHAVGTFVAAGTSIVVLRRLVPVGVYGLPLRSALHLGTISVAGGIVAAAGLSALQPLLASGPGGRFLALLLTGGLFAVAFMLAGVVTAEPATVQVLTLTRQSFRRLASRP